MSKVLNINGMTVKVIDNSEQQESLSQEDKDMDIRVKEAVKAALKKAKICGKSIARYDLKAKRAYIEDADGNRRYVE